MVEIIELYRKNEKGEHIRVDSQPECIIIVAWFNNNGDIEHVCFGKQKAANDKMKELNTRGIKYIMTDVSEKILEKK